MYLINDVGEYLNNCYQLYLHKYSCPKGTLFYWKVSKNKLLTAVSNMKKSGSFSADLLYSNMKFITAGRLQKYLGKWGNIALAKLPNRKINFRAHKTIIRWN